MFIAKIEVRDRMSEVGSQRSVYFSCSIFLTRRAGLPATMVLGATSLVTTLPAPMMAFSPTVIPQSKVAPEPIAARFLIRVGTHSQSLADFMFPSGGVERGKRSLVKQTLCPIKTSSSRVTPSQRKEWLLILQRLPTL